MAWVKLDDKFRVHPKLLAVSPVAGWLWVCALGYCNDHFTDGAVPGRGLIGVAPTIRNPLRYAEELVKAGLWATTESGWQIHDYHDYQPTAEEVIAKKAAVSAVRAVAGRLGGVAKAKQDASKPLANGQQNPSPVPVPVPEEESTALSRRAATARNGHGFSEESKAILDWLNDKAGKNFQPVAAHLRFVEARLKDHEPWVLRKVVTMKVKEWREDAKSNRWLRPKTLFNETNFANYVGELPATGADDVSAG